MKRTNGTSGSCQRPSKLHLGCFDHSVEGWINTDITPHIWIARIPGAAALLWRLGGMTAERFEQHKKGVFRSVRYLDVTKRFPYGDNTLDAVFSSHMLEHLYLSDAEACIAEVRRTLKPGGIFRIAVPDLDWIVATYDSFRPEIFLKRVFERDGRSKNRHHWHYNSSYLLRLLEAKNFSKAYRCAYRQGRCPDLELLDNRPEESLFVEATK